MESCYFYRKSNAYFSAKAGTKPIYSDCMSEIDKYISAKMEQEKCHFIL